MCFLRNETLCQRKNHDYRTIDQNEDVPLLPDSKSANDEKSTTLQVNDNNDDDDDDVTLDNDIEVSEDLLRRSIGTNHRPSKTFVVD
jgi:hypothetical protein